jgi:UPF0716 protein FxsA
MSLLRWLLLLFCIVPILELALLLLISDYTSWTTALVLVLATGILGAWLVRQEGFRCWRQIQDELSQGRVPAKALLDGLLIFAAGVLLLTPGVMTDLLAVLLLVPISRRWVRGFVSRRFQARLRFYQYGTLGEAAPRDQIIDVKFTEPQEQPERRE